MMKTFTLPIFLASTLIACGGSSNSTSNTGSSTTDNGTPNGNTQVDGNTCVNDNAFGIAQVPASASALYKTTFCKYLPLTVSNGKTIGFYAQAKVSDDQLIRAQRILNFYLEAVPNSNEGSNKTAIANRMADNGAHMMLLNGADGDIELSDGLQGQPLYEKEMITEGSVGYLSGNPEQYRDASFEEILHLMHDYGIGTESQPGANMTFSGQIKTARENAMTQQLWPTAAAAQENQSWINELRNEGSLSQEYLASVVDSYYGYWGSFTGNGGMWGIYTAKNRSEVEQRDPQGFQVMQAYFNPYISYMARIDSNFEGTFEMSFNAGNAYTHKSQYLLNARLTGSNNSNLSANDQDNKLAGNSGNNTINGLAGNDTLVLIGKRGEYNIQQQGENTVITDSINNRDGSTTIINIEHVEFSDGTVAISAL